SFTVLDGTAKPTPLLPPESLSIWELTPITRPLTSNSGPPELPWLIAASVWIAPSIGVLSGDVISRFSALTIPLVTVVARPNGEPTATTSSPTRTVAESPSTSGCSCAAGAWILTTATSLAGSAPTTLPRYVDPSAKRTSTLVASLTTCSLVMTWPFASYTNPEPCACCVCWPKALFVVLVTSISTTERAA